jgi:ketosteroid isomerase-like protein
MSQENVEVVRRDVAARSMRDWATLAAVWHPDIQLEVIAELAAVTGTATFRGFDEIKRFFDGLSDLYAEYRVEADEIIDAGECVITAERIEGRGLKGSGAPTWLQERFFRVIGFKDGKVWRVKEYRTRGAALGAAGLSE